MTAVKNSLRISLLKNATDTAAITAAEAAKTGRYSFEVSSCFVYFKADRQFMSGAISKR